MVFFFFFEDDDFCFEYSPFLVGAIVGIFVGSAVTSYTTPTTPTGKAVDGASVGVAVDGALVGVAVDGATVGYIVGERDGGWVPFLDLLPFDFFDPTTLLTDGAVVMPR